MKIQDIRQPVAGKSNRAQALQSSSPLNPKDSMQFSQDAPADAPEHKETHKSPWGVRLFAGIGLGLVGLSLAGCGGGSVPTPPTPPNNEKPVQSTATSLTQRLEQLRSGKDKAAYTQMSEAGYYQTLLRAVAGEQNAAAKPVAEAAQKANAAFDFKGDPAAQQKSSREALEALSKVETKDPVVAKYVEAAKAALQIGDAFRVGAEAPPSGLIAQIKGAAYEQGFPKVIEQLRLAPDKVKETSGMDPAAVRNYTESLTLTTQTALDFAKELNDPSLNTVLYQATGDSLYNRVKTDGQFLGGQVTAALELIQKVRQSGLFGK